MRAPVHSVAESMTLFQKSGGGHTLYSTHSLNDLGAYDIFKRQRVYIAGSDQLLTRHILIYGDTHVPRNLD